jgi:BCD family chlorophyll transporter-like MFS transporter
MQMAGARSGGVRIGLWGAAQALAFALGGLGGAGAIQAARSLLPLPSQAYGLVLILEAGLFLLAALQASKVFGGVAATRIRTIPDGMTGAVR